MSKPVTQRIKFFINDKEIQNTITGMRKGMREFRNAANKATQGSEDWKKYNAALAELEVEYKKAVDAQKEFNKDTKLTKAGIDKNQQAITNFTGSLSDMFQGLKHGDLMQAKEGFDGVKTGIKGATSAAWSFIATPVGALIAGLVGIGLAAKEWFSYNEAVKEANIQTQAITNLAGQELDNARIRAQALSEIFTESNFEENLETAKSLVKSFGISYDEAFDIIEDSYVRGATANKEFNDSLIEFSALQQKAGFTAKETASIINTAYEEGVYKDKLIDSIKEIDLALTEQTTSAKEALENAFGANFTDNLLNNIKSGAISTKDAIALIAKETETANLNQQQYAQLTADIFKGAGEDVAGAEKVLSIYNKALNEQAKALTPLQEETKRLSDAHLEMKQAQDNALKSDSYNKFSNDVIVLWTKTKTFFYNFIGGLVNAFQNFTLKFKLGYTSIESYTETFGQRFSNFKSLITGLISALLSSVSHLADAFNHLKNFEFSKASQSFSNFKNSLVNSASDVYEEYKKVNQEIDKIGDKARLDVIKNHFNSIKAAGDLEKENQETTVNNNSTSSTTETSTETELTPEDKRIIASKKKLKEWLDQWETDNKIKEEIKGLEEDEAAQLEEELELEEKYAKLEEQAFGETELLKSLEEKKNAELDAIEKKWNDKFWADYKKNKEKLKAEDKKYKAEQVKAEFALQNAKSDALSFGLSALKSFAKQGSAEYKVLFGLQQLAAAAEVILAGQRERAAYAANPTWSAMPDGGAIIKGKHILASKIRTGISLASIAATTIKSLDKGGFTFSGNYSGGMDGIGGQLAMIHPDEYMIPKPVMQMPEVPVIVEYLEAKRTGKPISSLAEGGTINTTTTTNTTPTTSTDNSSLAYQIERLNNHLDSGLKIYYTLNDEVERQKLEDQLNDTITNAKT